ncbi:MAG: cation diffusion facilitator family transporter [Brevinematales bacterium]
MTRLRFISAISLNAAIVIGELVFGFLSNSMSLLTDAFHNLSDVLSLSVAFIAFIYSSRKATTVMTYGYIRSEMMAGFVHSIFLLLSMAFIIFEAVKRLFSPGIVNSSYMIGTAIAAFAVNFLSAMLFREGAHSHEGHDHENMNIAASYLHLLSDAGLSIGVAIGGLLILFFHITIIDPIASIVFSIFVLTGSVRIFKKTFLSLMDAGSENMDEVIKKILTHHEIKSLHDIHIIEPSSKDRLFSAHLVLDKNLSLEKIETLLEDLRCELADLGITHILFQPETEKYHALDNLCQSHF